MAGAGHELERLLAGDDAVREARDVYLALPIDGLGSGSMLVDVLKMHYGIERGQPWPSEAEQQFALEMAAIHNGTLVDGKLQRFYAQLTDLNSSGSTGRKQTTRG